MGDIPGGQHFQPAVKHVEGGNVYDTEDVNNQYQGEVERVALVKLGITFRQYHAVSNLVQVIIIPIQLFVVVSLFL